MRAVARNLGTNVSNLGLWQAVGAVALVFIGIAQYRVYDRQSSIMDQQKTVMDQQKAIMDKQADISAAQGRDGRTALRPWIEVTTIKPGPPPDVLKVTVGEPAKIGGLVTNIGQTPALQPHGTYFLIRVAADSAPRLTTFNTSGKLIGTGVIFPKRDIPLHAVLESHNFVSGGDDPLPLSANDVEDWTAGRAYFVLYGKITYGDVFNVEHWTDFCFVFSADISSSATSRAGNCVEFNDVDDNQTPGQ
jgi:hypothetical protein